MNRGSAYAEPPSQSSYDEPGATARQVTLITRMGQSATKNHLRQNGVNPRSPCTWEWICLGSCALAIHPLLGSKAGEAKLRDRYAPKCNLGTRNMLLVRALGPSLSQSGIANPLAHPTLGLYDGQGMLDK